LNNFFQKLFRRTARANDKVTELTTAPLSEEQLEPLTRTGVHRSEPPQLLVGSARSVGMQRDHNEDSLFTLSANIAGNTTSLPFGIYIVADGMGGHQYGEVASEIAVRAMSRQLVQKLYAPIFNVRPDTPADSLQEIMVKGVMDAHEAVVKEAPGGGTTLTVVVILGNRMTLAHVGDSRAYAVYLDGRMQILTRDHSLVKRLEELGQISPEEAEVHPQRNVLYRALGQAEPFEPDVTTAPLPQPGYVLICSDGLWGLVSDADMFRIIAEAPTPQRACQLLVEAANQAGGPDNITAILIRMPD
jgi:protein phosphatase